MVGRAATVLDGRRAGALGLVLLLLGTWGAGAGTLPDLGTPLDVAVVAVVLMPLTFAVAWFALPLAVAPARSLAGLATALLVLALLLHAGGFGALFNVAKIAVLTVAGYWFLQLFEALSWVALVAVIIPWVDAVSVWRGPTDYVVTQKPGLFDAVAVAFRLPGENGSANLGPPDVLFLALFVASAARFGLRAGWTWLTTVVLLGLTLIVTAALGIAGLPALPAISLGFLLPNADLLWRAWRGRGAGP